MTDEWRDIPGHPNYQIARDGRVRNKKRGNILKWKKSPSRGGYYWKVDLGRSTDPVLNKKKSNQYVNRLVSLAFHGDAGEEVDHLDGDVNNNHADNLEPVSQLENIARRHGKGDAWEPEVEVDMSFEPEKLERKQA